MITRAVERVTPRPLTSTDARNTPCTHSHVPFSLHATQVRAGDWTCPSCHANCFASKSSCFKCGTTRAGEAGGAAAARAGDWTCPSCHANCFASKSNCFKCGQTKPSSRLGGVGGAAGEGAIAKPVHGGPPRVLANVQLAEHVRVTAEPLSDAETRLVEGEVIDRLADIAPLLRCASILFSRPHACTPSSYGLM
jgi:hypothetical protein